MKVIAGRFWPRNITTKGLRLLASFPGVLWVWTMYKQYHMTRAVTHVAEKSGSRDFRVKGTTVFGVVFGRTYIPLTLRSREPDFLATWVWWGTSLTGVQLCPQFPCLSSLSNLILPIRVQRNYSKYSPCLTSSVAFCRISFLAAWNRRCQASNFSLAGSLVYQGWITKSAGRGSSGRGVMGTGVSWLVDIGGVLCRIGRFAKERGRVSIRLAWSQL